MVVPRPVAGERPDRWQQEAIMDDQSRAASSSSAGDENQDWYRTIPPDEAQRTAQEADPDDLGSTSPTDIGLTAGGEGTAVAEDDEGAGGTPYTEGYVTGGVHHPTIADLPPTNSDE
jgi:hypothetical protein